MKRLLTLGLLSGAAAHVLDTTDEESFLEQSNINIGPEMTIGTFLVKKHSTQGYFDVSCSMTNAYFQGQQSNPTAVTIVLENQAGINDVTMEWSHSSCGTNGAVFGDLPDNIFDTGNGAQANLAGCLRMNQDGNKYGYYQKNIEIQ